MAYLDTSILGAYYCPETLSDAAGRAIQSLSSAAISPLVEVEFCSLLSLKVREGLLTRAAASAALGQFKLHISDRAYAMIEIGPREYELARDWLGAFDTPLRALDALHLAAAFANGQVMLTTDRGIAASAKLLHVPCNLIVR